MQVPLWPLALAALGLLAWPVWLHLRHRDAPRTLRFSALELLWATPVSSDTHRPEPRRLHLLWLLMSRAGLIALLALALGEPTKVDHIWLPATVHEVQSAILVVDNGAASQLQARGAPLIDRWKRHASTLLSALPAASQVLVLPTHAHLATDDGRASPRPAWNVPRHLLSEHLEALTPTLEVTRWPDALAKSQALLAQAAHAKKVVYAFGLAPKNSQDLEKNLGLPIVWVDPGIAAPPQNVAIKSVTLLPDDPSAAHPGASSVRIVLENSGATPATEHRIGLRLVSATTSGEKSGVVKHSKHVDIPAHGHATVDFSVAWDEDRDVVGMEAFTQKDAFEPDNHHFTVLRAVRPLELLLLRGAGHTQTEQDELFYLEAALRAAKQERLPIHITVRSAASEPWPLDGKDVVFLCNVPAPSVDRIADLTTYVERGGGLVVTVGDETDPVRYRRNAARWLPSAPISVHTFTTTDTAPATTTIAWDLAHPALRALDAKHHRPRAQAQTPQTQEEGGGRGRTTPVRELDAGALALTRALLFEEPSPPAKTIARMGTGAPLVMEKPMGQGSVLVLATTIDRDWSDLPIRPFFVPVIAEWVRYLGHQGAMDQASTYHVGDPISFEPPSVWQGDRDSQAAIVATPSGRSLRYAPSDMFADSRVGFTEEIGFYTVYANEAHKAKGTHALVTYATNIDPGAATGPWQIPPPPSTAATTSDRKDARASSAQSIKTRSLVPSLGLALLVLLAVEAVLLGIQQTRTRTSGWR